MTAYFAAAAVLLAGLGPLIVFSIRASPPDGLVALNLGGTIATLVLMLRAGHAARKQKPHRRTRPLPFRSARAMRKVVVSEPLMSPSG